MAPQQSARPLVRKGMSMRSVIPVLAILFVLGCTRTVELDLARSAADEFPQDLTYTVFTTSSERLVTKSMSASESGIVVHRLESDVLGVKEPIKLRWNEIDRVEVYELREGATFLALVGAGVTVAVLWAAYTWNPHY